MPTLFFVRHAESEANAKLEYAGHLAIPLTARGRAEAEHTSFNFCKNHSVTKIICSPLLRAQQTAAYFANKLNLPIELSPLIEEQDMGIFTGKAYAVAEKHPSFQHDVGKRWDWAPENGESYKQVAARACQFLSEVEKLPKQENVLVVTHGVFLRLMRGALENTLPIFYTGLTKNCEILQTNFISLNQKNKIDSIYFGEPDTRVHGE